MRKTLYFLTFLSVIFLTGCFDTTQEVTLNKDGSGILQNTTDLSNAIGMLKSFGGDDAEKLEKMTKDTTINLSAVIDSMKTLSAEEKELIKNGTLRINISMSDEKFITELKIPFSKTEDISRLNAITGKVLQQSMKDQMNGGGDASANPLGGDEAGDNDKKPAIDDYFTTSYSKGTISRSLNKEKYATAADDEGLKALKEMSGMGAPMTMHLIYHLPKEVKKAEGKGIKISDDKKTITLDATIDDFFNDPSKMEFSIEY